MIIKPKKENIKNIYIYNHGVVEFDNDGLVEVPDEFATSLEKSKLVEIVKDGKIEKKEVKKDEATKQTMEPKTEKKG